MGYDVSADKISAEQLADEFGLSPTQITRIIYKTSAKLFRHVEYPLDKP